MSENGNSNSLQCFTKDCRSQALMFCITCNQLFCSTHNQEHNAFQKILQTPHDVIPAEEYPKLQEKEDFYCCSIHDEYKLVLACELCYQLMCAKCIDEATVSGSGIICETADTKGLHKARVIEQVANRIRDELRDLLCECRIEELTNADDLNERRKLYDKQLEENRSDLEIIAMRIKELELDVQLDAIQLQKIDKSLRQLRETLVTHVNRKKSLMTSWETEFRDYQECCQHATEQTTAFLKHTDRRIIKEHKQVKDTLTTVLAFRFKDSPEQMRQLSFIFSDDSSSLVSFQTRTPHIRMSRVPRTIGFSNIIVTTSEEPAFSVEYTQDGHLVNSADCKVAGQNFKPVVPCGMSRCNDSLYRHKDFLYVLQHFNDNYRVHVKHLENLRTFDSVIAYPAGGGNQHLSVSKNHISIVDYSSKAVKIYSTKTYTHMFDIKLDCFNSRPWGVASLDDSIIVCDHCKSQVSKISVEKTPRLLWTCTGIVKPTAIVVCEESQSILVASYDRKQIHVLSYEGQKLGVLDVPNCGLYIHDLAVSGRKLAIADGTNQIRIYSMR